MDDPKYESAMIILKEMVERSRVRTTNGDAIRRITKLECDEINEGVYCLKKMKLVKTLPDVNKVFYDFFNVTIRPEGYDYYDEHIAKIKSIEE